MGEREHNSRVRAVLYVCVWVLVFREEGFANTVLYTVVLLYGGF